MDTILRAALMYLVVLIILRVTTRRIMRSATPLDLSVIFLFGGMAVQPILGEDRSITGALLAIGTVAVLHTGISSLKLRWPTLARITDGTPVIIYTKGSWDLEQMRKMRVQEQDVLAEARLSGLRSLDEAESVIVEHNGGITIMRKAS